MAKTNYNLLYSVNSRSHSDKLKTELCILYMYLMLLPPLIPYVGYIPVSVHTCTYL